MFATARHSSRRRSRAFFQPLKEAISTSTRRNRKGVAGHFFTFSKFKTMSTKHTPAPWLLNTLAGELVIMSNGRLICNTSKLPERQANAHLIAAAPELLGCLTGLEHDPTPIDWISALLCEFERHYQPEIDDDPDATSDAKMHVRRFIEKARKAVKKAEGVNYTNADAEREERILEDIESRPNYDRF